MTIVTSSSSMNVPTQTMPSVHHLRVVSSAVGTGDQGSGCRAAPPDGVGVSTTGPWGAPGPIIRRDASARGDRPCHALHIMRTCVRMIVCVLHPRFELTVAASRRDALASGPLALAPEPGREQRIGEVSAAAEAFGVQAGMMLGEALARCAVLELVPADPVGVAERWEATLRALESHGAAVESIGPGIACFSATGLLGLHGGDMARLLTAVRRSLDGPARLGAGPTRFCALAAASTARPRRPVVVADRPQAARQHLDPSRSPCCARAPPPRTWSSRWRAWACARWASWPACPATRWQTASEPRVCWPIAWRWARTNRCGRAVPVRACPKRSSCPNRRPGPSSSERLTCCSTVCLRAASGAGARCASWSSRRGWWRAGRGASGWCFARPSRTPRACAWRSPLAWRCCPRPPRPCA